MFTTLALLNLLTVSGGAPTLRPAAISDRGRIQVWTSRGDDPYTSGQAVRVYFRTEQDAYVTILRVDTDGRVRVLFPRHPWEDNFARGGRDYEVLSDHDRDAFYIDDYPGVGYLFAVTAADPFVYDAIESGEHWDYRVIADGRVRGDPYVALTDLAQRIVPDGYSNWDYDIVPYYVQQHYDYPRFLCYDCHSYVSYPYWSPYDYSCVRFRIVVFDDPYYYPYRYYGGTRVVFTRPLRPEPRFIFTDRQGQDAFVTRVRERPVNEDRRRDVGVRGRDLGGIGIIPRPRIKPPQQRPGNGDENGGGRDDQDHGRRRPDHPDHPERPDQRDHRDQPDRRDRPDHSDRPDHRAQPDRPDRSGQRGQQDVVRPDRGRPESPAMVQPDRPRPEPRREPEARPQPEPRRAEPPRAAEPRREAPPPPRAQPSAAPAAPRGEPELKRRKP